MLIRTEIGIDAPGIDRLLKNCFGSEQEAERVRQLREQGLLTLGMVATDDEGQVLGYAAFSPVTLAGEDKGWVLLSPLAIDAACRSLALDEQLVREALDTLNEFGYGAVVARESLPCLTQVGFRPGEKLYYQLPADNRQQTLLIYPLANDPVGDEAGELQLSAPFYG